MKSDIRTVINGVDSLTCLIKLYPGYTKTGVNRVGIKWHFWTSNPNDTATPEDVNDISHIPEARKCQFSTSKWRFQRGCVNVVSTLVSQIFSLFLPSVKINVIIEYVNHSKHS